MNKVEAIASSDFVQTGGGLVLLVVAVIFCAAWTFLPFMLLGKLNEIIKRLKSIETEAEATARNTRRDAAVRRFD